ncbi:lysophospholipid acyltransferase family protein [Pedobacter chitinilyticus]|uniref:1-acyl-sn-glycerol-3-phosphate acyltransferase n=1 Tax=Pedobacter chitinilyticus TaxID=2233776 RepID=A0A3S3PTU2_9SPHI|nr:lysophospholipid acyltransferase family protein [Pedobacter chitinilyticus]RWU07492.1 1-acyl-sn-glycerol-3-phosphate acyltransferase [Pedobacter chitinilyticus]
MGRILSTIFLLYAAIIFIALMFVALPFVLLFSAILPLNTGKRAILIVLRTWAWLFSILSLFWVRTKNKEIVDLNKSHIYVGNHGSYLDAVVVCLSIPQYFSALGKVEITKVPVFGLIYKRIVVLIDRSSKESREQSVNALKKDITNGQSILIFAEGTMNKTEKPLTDFYDGAFRIAIETQTPIIPFVMINNRKLLPRKHPLKARPGIITTILLSEISVAGLSLEDVPALKKKVYDLMEEAIIRNSPAN